MRDEATSQGGGVAYPDERGWVAAVVAGGQRTAARGPSAEEATASLRAGLEEQARARGVLPRLTAQRTVEGLVAALDAQP